MLKMTRLSASMAAAMAAGAFGMLGAGGAVAQQSGGQELKRVEITGSAIRRQNVEGPAPVEIVTRKDIDRTGATSINQLIRSIPSIDILDTGELASNSPSGSGTANIRMRGLSESNVLILLNGRRMPVNALYDSSGAGGAVDINTIPVSAIDRIEVLKDGGSAIYGADAVAGVVNIITKTDFQGIEALAGYGQASRGDGTEKRVTLTGGFGDLASDRFNVLLSLDVFKRDPILRKDRETSNTVDFRAKGGPDRRSSFSPTGNIANPNTGAFVGQTYKACPPENFNIVCRYDFNQSLLTAYNGADRMSGLAVASFQVTPDIKAFAELTASTSKDTFLAHPVPDFFSVPIIDPSQTAFEDPLNPGTVLIAGRFMQGGPRTTERKSDFLNLAIGAEGTSFGLDWKVNAGRGESKVRNQDSNYFDANLWVPATSNGSIDPTIGTNPQALVDSLKVRPTREGKATIQYLNLQVGGDLYKLPAGMLRYAVGASHTEETLKDTPDPLTQAGEVVGSIRQAAVDASRTQSAMFGELSIPVLSNLEAQAAIRYDKYPSYSQSSPKLAAKYTPIPQVAFRASYSESFRAPVLKQLFGAQEQGAINITNPAQCTALGVALAADGSCLINAFQVNGANPDLKPETGKTTNFGVVFEVNQNINASVDVWNIRKQNNIATPTITTAINNGLFSRQGARTFVFTNLQNSAEADSAGVDLDARVRLPGTAIGNVTLRNLVTYYTSIKTRAQGSSEWAEFNGTYNYPRWRNALFANVETGPWTYGAAIRTIAGFADTDEPAPVPTGTRRIGTYDELDVQVAYAGIKNLTLTGGVRNLLDRAPPFSLTNASDNQYTQMGFAEQYSNRGRFFYGSVNYKFR